MPAAQAACRYKPVRGYKRFSWGPLLFLDFIGLKDGFNEKNLEDMLLVELEKFILEMGSDFAFLGRQKRVTIDGEDYYIDLLFYHRKMKRLVVIELKLDKFRPDLLAWNKGDA